MNKDGSNPVRDEAVVRAHAWAVRLWNERKISADFTSDDEAELVEMLLGFLAVAPYPEPAEYVAARDEAAELSARLTTVTRSAQERYGNCLDKLQQTEAYYKEKIDNETAEFNAGYEACHEGLPIDAEPDDLAFDVWRHGWIVAHYERTQAEMADLRRQLAECQARCNRMESFCAVHGVEMESTTQNHPLPPVSDGALWPGCFDGEVEL